MVKLLMLDPSSNPSNSFPAAPLRFMYLHKQGSRSKAAEGTYQTKACFLHIRCMVLTTPKTRRPRLPIARECSLYTLHGGCSFKDGGSRAQRCIVGDHVRNDSRDQGTEEQEDDDGGNCTAAGITVLRFVAGCCGTSRRMISGQTAPIHCMLQGVHYF